MLRPGMKKGYVPGLSAVLACLSDGWLDLKQSGKTVIVPHPENLRLGEFEARLVALAPAVAT